MNRFDSFLARKAKVMGASMDDFSPLSKDSARSSSSAPDSSSSHD